MNRCKIITGLCKSSNYLFCISQEEQLVWNIYHIPFSRWLSTPGRFTHNNKNDEIYKSTKVLSWYFGNLKTRVKRHFENKVLLKNDYDWQENENYKGICEAREHAVSMRIVGLCYASYLIGSSKMNFEQEILKSVLNGLGVGDINHSSELSLKFMLFASEQVIEQLQSFFSSRLDHIGYKQPVYPQTNKGANVHRTRQFTLLATFATEPSKLLTYMHLGQPLFKNHDGHGVTLSIIDVLYSLMDNIFILAFLNILQKLFIFRTNLFKRGILSVREM